MARDKNDRQGVVRLDQFLLQFKTPESRHADIEHQAAVVIAGKQLEEFVRRIEYLMININRLE